ncbi:MAG TPA: DMT family transporter [Anaerolineales bacterium]|nr:DMT family transporter [Anaerolineales bacterium]
MISILYGILSAASWGAADFIGGIATKRTAAYRVLFLAEVASLFPFLITAILIREPVPPIRDLVWGAAASLVGLAGLTILYRALADGRMSITAPISAMLAAVVPVIFGLLTLGIPAPATIIGFGLAFGAVWLISQTDALNWRLPLQGLRNLSDLRLPLFSGIFFGFYFVLIHNATQHAFFWPLVAARFAGFVAFGLYALITHQPALPPRDVWGYSIVNGLIDIAGNAFFVLSAQAGRVDVAAVLGAFYPASTVLLAWILLKERVNYVQATGIALAFAAIVLFTV